MFENNLMNEIRERFCHVDTCPYSGPRIFFENAGGGLTLKSVVEVNTTADSIGHANPYGNAFYPTYTTLKTEQARGSFAIAQWHEKKRKYPGALIYYNEAILNAPDSGYAEEARTRIDRIQSRIASEQDVHTNHARAFSFGKTACT